MIEATKVLRREHVHILKAVAILESIADRVRGAASIPTDDLFHIMQFFHVFADGNHHAKEEAVLFPEIRAAGISSSQGALLVLEDEHDQERALIDALSTSIGDLQDDTRENRSQFVEHAQRFASFQRQHMHKENTILFPVIEQLLSAADDRRILEMYRRYEELGFELDELLANLDTLASKYLD